MAVFHGFNFTSADTVVQDPFFSLKGFEFWKSNNPHSMYLILVCLMGLPNILADCLGNFSTGPKLGKGSCGYHLYQETERFLSLFPCPLPPYHRE